MNENTPIIQTERLILRRFAKDDAAALLDILSDVEVNAFLPWFPIKNHDEAKEFLQQRFLDYYDKPSAYRYAICMREDNKPIGYVCLADSESNDFGYAIGKAHWHRGIATEAAKVVVEQIKKSGYRYITATHDRNNPHSGEVMKKLGMSYRYSYVEQWQPKDVLVTFRMYQLNFDGNGEHTYMEYWDNSQEHFVEEDI